MASEARITYKQLHTVLTAASETISDFSISHNISQTAFSKSQTTEIHSFFSGKLISFEAYFQIPWLLMTVLVSYTWATSCPNLMTYFLLVSVLDHIMCIHRFFCRQGTSYFAIWQIHQWFTPHKTLTLKNAVTVLFRHQQLFVKGRYYGLFFATPIGQRAIGNVAQYVLQKTLYYLSAMRTPGVWLLQSLKDFTRAFILQITYPA